MAKHYIVQHTAIGGGPAPNGVWSEGEFIPADEFKGGEGQVRLRRFLQVGAIREATAEEVEGWDAIQEKADQIEAANTGPYTTALEAQAIRRAAEERAEEEPPAVVKDGVTEPNPLAGRGATVGTVAANAPAEEIKSEKRGR
jgi:hypothetical protein